MSRHEKKLAEAKKRVREMDEVDGFDDRSIGAIISALNDGLKNDHPDSAYDALFMLQDCQDVLRGSQNFNIANIKALLMVEALRAPAVAGKTQ